MEWYLDRSRLPFAILTNGQLWRLIPREIGQQQRRFQTYLEFDLRKFLENWLASPDLNEQAHLLEEFMYLYLFFGPAGLRETAERKPLARRALDGSSEYRLGVGEGLKERTFEALRLCIEGFLSHKPNHLLATVDLEPCRRHSFTLLYRLLFIMFAEDRRLLPYKRNRLYTNNRSLGRYRDEIASRLDKVASGLEEDYSTESTALWQDLMDLFDLVDAGNRTYGVPPYNGGLFNREQHPFLTEVQLSDWYLARLIDQLGRSPDEFLPDADLFRVDYHDLAIQHLGTIYEGLLELRPRWTNDQLIVIARRVGGRIEERYLLATENIPAGYTETDKEYPANSIYLQTDNGERRESGSYYTPDHIVDYIVANTLGPICQDLSQNLAKEIAQAYADGRVNDAEVLEHDFDRRVLALRVLDPSMGSGHFLLRACQYLAEEIATNPNTRESVGEGGDEAAIGFWKRQVVEQCLYGVDMNSMAVELAKLALWLETVAADQPLSFLDHHLRHGNSLIGASISRMGTLPGAPELHQRAFADRASESLPGLLNILDQIRRQPSETAHDVKEKERLFRRFENARQPFLQLADLWCSKYAETTVPGLSEREYDSALAVVANPKNFKKLTREPWFIEGIERARQPNMCCFCWELEFPEVFFDRHSAGFDAIIGNPPYDVLSELENDSDLTAFRAVIDDDPVYAATLKGKNNLYKLFVCKALDLLAARGYLGFITPMAILGDEQAVQLRRQMLRVGSFRAIEAFPQKDDPTRRIFPEAKLSTAVFVLVKDDSPESETCPFQARVHPGRLIAPTSPGLTLTTASIPLYDPANFTIVSCDQADWDLAVRIMGSGRMTRLKNFVAFFQGEVNETNERKNGTLANAAGVGKLVTRGASICLYVTRPASQGNDLYIDLARFLQDKAPGTKAFHYMHPRVGLQESSPQNNFRRIIAAHIPSGEHCNHKVNYCPAPASKIDIRLLLALLNSKLADWYFRLGSTNASVSHYQLYNLPCPSFHANADSEDESFFGKVWDAMYAGAYPTARKLLAAAVPRPRSVPSFAT